MKTSDVELRVVSKIDEEEIENVREKAIQDSSNFPPDRKEKLLSQSIPDQIYNGKNETVIAEIDGSVIGWGSLDVENNALSGLFIIPKFQSNGIGSEILEEIEKIADNKNMTNICIFSNPESTSFYENKGYQKIDEFEMGINESETVPTDVLRKIILEKI